MARRAERNTDAHTVPSQTEWKTSTYAASGETEDRHACRPGWKGRMPRMPRRAERKTDVHATAGRMEDRCTYRRLHRTGRKTAAHEESLPRLPQASGKKKLRPLRPDALDAQDAVDETLLLRMQLARAPCVGTQHARALCVGMQHAKVPAPGRSCYDTLCLDAECQGICLLDEECQGICHRTQCVPYRRRVLRQMSSGRRVPRHLHSGRGVSSGRSAYLTDIECHGKCRPDDACHGICLPDEEYQGICNPDAARFLQTGIVKVNFFRMQSVKANVVRTMHATASAFWTQSDRA